MRPRVSGALVGSTASPLPSDFRVCIRCGMKTRSSGSARNQPKDKRMCMSCRLVDPKFGQD